MFQVDFVSVSLSLRVTFFALEISQQWISRGGLNPITCSKMVNDLNLAFDDSRHLRSIASVCDVLNLVAYCFVWIRQFSSPLNYLFSGTVR